MYFIVDHFLRLNRQLLLAVFPHMLTRNEGEFRLLTLDHFSKWLSKFLMFLSGSNFLCGFLSGSLRLPSTLKFSSKYFYVVFYVSYVTMWFKFF